jgi:peptide-methionine (S)-S-oxide reductase
MLPQKVLQGHLLPVLALLGLATCWQLTACAGEVAVSVPAATVDAAPAAGGLQTAVLSGGCFWGVQGVFEHVRGVQKVISGYAGGERSTATYPQVSMGDTGHAESVQISFDPQKISYGELLRIFFSVAHDPTQLNRQGPDSGSQYRSAIVFMDAQQEKIARAYIEQLNQAAVFPHPIVTRVDAFKGFYPAEAYHQDYLIHNPHQPYIVFNDLPKIENLKRLFPDYYSAAPAMVAAR